MDEKLIEVDTQEVAIEFHPGVKCRADVRLRSLHATSAVAFKVQTSSPHKFLVNPPTALLPPLSSASFQVILRPQPHPPSHFPRSPSDRFLVKATAVASHDTASAALLPHPSAINAWFAARPHIPTHDVKLKVVYVGPFLLRHAVDAGDSEAARQILRRQRSLLSRLPPADSSALLRAAAASPDPSLLDLLLEAGIDPNATNNYPDSSLADEALPPAATLPDNPQGAGSHDIRPKDTVLAPLPQVGSSSAVAASASAASNSKGWTRLHAVAAAGSYDALARILDEEEQMGEFEGDGRRLLLLDRGDADGRTALHLAAGKGYVRCARALLGRGADPNARSKDGRTALHRAAANGDREMIALLLDAGADPAVATARGRTPLDVARDKGHKEVTDILERGELVLTAARRGDLKRLESLLKKGVGINCHDQYGMTALHSAAIKGHGDIVRLLAEFGMDLECQDVEGHTPLHLGVEGGCLDIVEVLVDLGADVNAKSKRGATPLYMAKTMGYEDISQLLVSRGASSSSSCVASSSSSLSSVSHN